MIKLNRGLIMNYRFFILVTILFFSCEQPDVGLGDGCESLIIDNYSENTQINLEQNSEESVTLTFKHLDCIKNYIISRKITTASDFEQIALLSEENWDLDNKEIIYTDFGDINYNYTYIYKVYGLDPIGNMSSQLINTIVPIFNAEILLNEIELDESDLKITWDFNLNNNVEIDYDFEIEWKTNSNADFELLDIIEDQNINEYSFIPESGIEPEDYYSFRIRIMTEYGNYSDWSEESKWQGINEPPVLDEISNQSIDEDQSIEIYLNATDPNNDILSYSVFSNEFEIQSTILMDSVLVLTPYSDWNGVSIVIVSVTDNYEIDEQNFNLTVLPINDIPTINPIPNQIVDEDNSISISLIANDVDGDELQFSVSSLNSDCLISSDNILTITPPQDFNGIDTITVDVSDGNGGTASTSFDLTVISINDDPEACVLPNQIFDEDFEDYTIDLNTCFSDDGSSLYYSVSLDNLGVVNAGINGDDLIISSIADQNGGPITVTITADDGNNRNTIQTSFNISVTPINDIPTINPIPNQIVDEDNSISISLIANDGDGDLLNFSAISNESELMVQTFGNILTLIPNLDWSGSATITVDVSDGNGGTASTSFDLTVISINDDPEACVLPNQIFDEDFEDYTIDLNTCFSDDGSSLYYSVSLDNLGVVNAGINGDDLIISSIPDQNGGPITVTITADDGNNRNTIQTSFNISVTPINDAPPVLDYINNQIIDEDETLTLILNAFDYDNDYLTYQVDCDNTANCSISGSVLTINPNVNFYGSIDAYITVSDGGNLGNDSQMFNLSVSPINDSPSITSDPILLAYTLPGPELNGETYSYQVTAVDVDDTILIYDLLSSPLDMTISSDGLIEWAPEQGVYNSGIIEVRVSDDEYAYDLQVFSILVTQVDCNGVIDGEAIIDNCEICSGGDTGLISNADQDCADVCFGTAFEDDCGVCSGGTSDHIANSDQDCSGECFGDALVDVCGICEGDGTWCLEASITLGNVTDTNLEVLYDSPLDIGGFQFDISGVNILSGSGGAAADAGFEISISTSGSTVLGFAFDGSVVPAGNGILTILGLESNIDDNEACLSAVVLSDNDGDQITANIGDCVIIPACLDADGDGICDDIDNCVGEYDECGVCNGDGIADDECDCDGNILDECGICGGDGQDADGDGICDDIDNCVGEYDECGVCNGDGIADDECDCDGNVLDECGICGGVGPEFECNDGEFVCSPDDCQE